MHVNHSTADKFTAQAQMPRQLVNVEIPRAPPISARWASIFSGGPFAFRGSLARFDEFHRSAGTREKRWAEFKGRGSVRGAARDSSILPRGWNGRSRGRVGGCINNDRNRQCTALLSVDKRRECFIPA